MKKAKKILSILLTVCMVLSALSQLAFAVPADPKIDTKGVTILKETAYSSSNNGLKMFDGVKTWSSRWCCSFDSANNNPYVVFKLPKKYMLSAMTSAAYEDNGDLKTATEGNRAYSLMALKNEAQYLALTSETEKGNYLADKNNWQNIVSVNNTNPQKAMVTTEFKTNINTDIYRFDVTSGGKDGNEWSNVSELELYGEEKTLVNPKTITFNNGGGTGDVVKQVVESGTEFTLPENMFTAPQDKNFAGWKVGNDTLIKQPNDKAIVNSDVVITAQWKDIKYVNISFLSNGGTGTMANVKYDSEELYALPDCLFYPPQGKCFAGWLINGETKQSGEKISVPTDTILTAQWGDLSAHTITQNDKEWKNVKATANGNITINSRIEIKGNVVLHLNEGAVLTITKGIHVPTNSTLIIEGTGTLNATGLCESYENAAIGGNSHETNGPITINGGVINANVNAGGTVYGAGIGGGWSASGGDITINGGTITANGGNSAGIGGGNNGGAGNILITGGTVLATVKWEYGKGNPIGAGAYGEQGGSVTITGGHITARGRESSAIGDKYGKTVFSTGENGNAIIIASTENANYQAITYRTNIENWSGFISEDGGKTFTVYGNQTINKNGTVPADKSLIINNNSSIEIPEGVTVTNNGTLTNNGVIFLGGTYEGTTNGTVYYKKQATFNTDGGSAVAPIKQYTTKTIVLPSSEKQNYTFVGWNDGFNTYKAGDTYTMTENDVTFTAVWKENPKAIFVTTIGEKIEPIHAPTVDGGKIELPYFDMNGNYEFVGWEYNGTIYDDFFEMPANDVTFTAVWKLLPKATFDSKGGEPVESKYGEPMEDYTIRLPMTTKAGYMLIGWQCGDQTFEQGSLYHLTGDTSFTAVWKELPKPQSNGYYYIYTPDDLSTLSTACDVGLINLPIKVRLMADLNFDDTQKTFRNFSGVFDGNGHTITVDFKTKGAVIAVLATGDATVKNLTVNGSMICGNTTNVAGLIYEINDNTTVKFDKCIVNLNMAGYSTNGFYGTNMYGSQNANIIINNSAFTGTMNILNQNGYGNGFGKGGKVAITNSYVAFEESSYDYEKITPFVDSNNPTITNSYCTKFLYDSCTTKQGEPKTNEEFANGTVCFLLNDGISSIRAPWKQNLDNGKPVDKFPSHKGGMVLKITSTYYSNIDLIGDISGDGEINSNDFAMAKAVMSGQTTLTEEQSAAADINGDGAVDGFDAIIIGLLANGDMPIENLSRNVYVLDKDGNIYTEYEMPLGSEFTLPTFEGETPVGEDFDAWDVNGTEYNETNKFVVRFVTIIKPKFAVFN